MNEQITESNNRQAKYYNANNRIKERDIKKGDEILVRRAEAKNKLCPKLSGPYIVQDVDKFNVFYKSSNGKQQKAHKNDVRVFKRRQSADGNYDSDEPRAPAEEPQEPSITRGSRKPIIRRRTTPTIIPFRLRRSKRTPKPNKKYF